MRAGGKALEYDMDDIVEFWENTGKGFKMEHIISEDDKEITSLNSIR